MVVPVAAAAAARAAGGRATAGRAAAAGERSPKVIRPAMNTVPGIGRKPGEQTSAQVAGPRPAPTARNNYADQLTQRHMKRGEAEVARRANDNEPRVGFANAAFMIGGAVVLDTVQFVLLFTVIGSLVGSVLSFIAFISYFVWFYLSGVNFFKGKSAGLKVAAAAGGTLGELLPFLNALPLMTPSVATVIFLSRRGNRGGNT